MGLRSSKPAPPVRSPRVVVDCRGGRYDDEVVSALAAAAGGAHRLVFQF